MPDAIWGTPRSETLTGAVATAAHDVPDRTFLRFEDGSLTYGDLLDQVARTAGGLRALGVARGDRVAVLLGNVPEMVISWFAVNWLGAIWVPINTANRGAFLVHQLDDAGARVVIVGNQLLERIEEIRTGLATAPQVVTVSDDGRPATFAELGTATPVTGIVNAPNDLTMLLYTSGTTGPSKGCMIPHGYLCHTGRTVLRSIERRPDEVQWSCLPLFHMHAVAATVASTLLLQGTSVIAKRFSVSGFWPAIEASGAAIAYLIGPMATLLADAPDSPASQRCRGQLRVVRGAPFPPEAAHAWRERFGVTEAGVGGYGLTEASPVVAMPYLVTAPPGTSGQAEPDYDVRIFDENDEELAAGSDGELVVRPRLAHIMFAGYWNRPAATMERWRDGWFHTGDRGRFDEAGFFTFSDRMKDCLRRRGENISSFEMEAAICSHPAVADVAVHAVASPLGEDDVKVTAVLCEGTAVTEAELWEWICEQVPDFAKPRYVEIRTELPRNAVGRVLKFQLRDEGATPCTWDAEAARGSTSSS